MSFEFPNSKSIVNYFPMNCDEKSTEPEKDPMQCDKVLELGPDCPKISLNLFKTNRERLLAELKKIPNMCKDGVILLKGGDMIERNHTEHKLEFQQESFFFWTFGVLEPGCYGVIVLRTCSVCLFIPQYSEEDTLFYGPPQTTDDFQCKYDVDYVYYMDQMVKVLRLFTGSDGTLYLLKGKNYDSDIEIQSPYFKDMDKFKVNVTTLFTVMSELRAIKTPSEKEVIRYAVRRTCEGHREAMLSVRMGFCEYQAEAIFLDHCYKNGGCRFLAHDCTVGSGERNSIMDYGHRSWHKYRPFGEGELCLFDMGAKYFGYAADISTCFPISGKFSKEQREIYQIVLEMSTAVQAEAKPDVTWVTLHLIACRTLLTQLLELGLIKGELETMMNSELYSVFFPHGIGHMIGLEPHEVGGYLPQLPPRPNMPGLKVLRSARALKPGMYITLEPGCYFNKYLLKRAYIDPVLKGFLVKDVIEQYKCVGGVRIKDNAFVTDRCLDIINTKQIPRTVDEIERLLLGTKY